jgi:hypothetical protein
MLEIICDTDYFLFLVVPRFGFLPRDRYSELKPNVPPEATSGFIFATPISKTVWLIMEEASLRPKDNFPSHIL